MTLGKRFRSLREKAARTQKELASRLNVPNQNISNYERGFRQPDYETLQKLADYYDVSTDYLLGRTDTLKKENNDNAESIKFFKNPELNLFFKEMADSPEEQIEELRDLWEFLQKRGLNKK